jgi:hypothetical protein
MLTLKRLLCLTPGRFVPRNCPCGAQVIRNAVNSEKRLTRQTLRDSFLNVKFRLSTA